MRAFIFPGQGSQAIGMGTELAAASTAARAVFEEVDDALGQKLSALMREGPADALTLTENAQPAIMANAIAVLRVLENEGGIRLAARADFVAGHLRISLTRDSLDGTDPNHVLTSANGITLEGLPALGFAVTNYVNGNATPGVLANYSGLSPHRTSVACANAANAQGGCP